MGERENHTNPQTAQGGEGASNGIFLVAHEKGSGDSAKAGKDGVKPDAHAGTRTSGEEERPIKG